MDRLRTDPISITDKDVDVIEVRRSEIVDHHKVRKFRTEVVVPKQPPVTGRDIIEALGDE